MWLVTSIFENSTHTNFLIVQMILSYESIALELLVIASFQLNKASLKLKTTVAW